MKGGEWTTCIKFKNVIGWYWHWCLYESNIAQGQHQVMQDFKWQEPTPLREHLCSSPCLVASVLLIPLVVCVLFVFVLCLVYCWELLWIVRPVSCVVLRVSLDCSSCVLCSVESFSGLFLLCLVYSVESFSGLSILDYAFVFFLTFIYYQNPHFNKN